MRDLNSVVVVLIRLCISFLCGLCVYGTMTIFLFKHEDVSTVINALYGFHPVPVVVGMIVFSIAFYISGFSNEKTGAPF